MDDDDGTIRAESGVETVRIEDRRPPSPEPENRTRPPRPRNAASYTSTPSDHPYNFQQSSRFFRRNAPILPSSRFRVCLNASRSVPVDEFRRAGMLVFVNRLGPLFGVNRMGVYIYATERSQEFILREAEVKEGPGLFRNLCLFGAASCEILYRTEPHELGVAHVVNVVVRREPDPLTPSAP